MWELHAPSNNGWSDASSLDGKRAQNSSPKIDWYNWYLGISHFIRGKVDGENVPTPVVP